MGHSNEELAKRRKQVCAVGENIFTNKESDEDFEEIIKLCLYIDELIKKVAKRADVEPRAVKRFLSCIKEYSNLTKIDE